MMRWKETFGRRTYAMAPFGIIEGEYDGLPFTVFDTQVPRRPDVVEAICVLHLPVSYPTIRVDADWLSVVPTPEQFARAFDGRPGKGPDPLLVDMMLSKHRIDPDSIRFTPPGSDFGRELLTPAVRGLMVRHGLRAWRIQGQDLISEGPMRAASLPATDLLRYVAVVVELARAIPAGLAHRYGTP